MKIGIDIDNVLADFVEHADMWHNKNYGTNVTTADHYEFSLSKFWNCTNEEKIERILKFYKSDEFKEMKIVPKSIEAIKNLAGDHELHIITSRPLSTEKETLRWLHKHFSLESFEKIHITEQMLSGSVKKTKAELCKDLGISIIIEDDLKYAENCAKVGIKVFLLDWPWNQSDNLHSNITRVNSWDDILNSLKSI